MKDTEIRTLIKRKLAKRKSFSDERFVEEAPILNGSVRADVVYCGSKLECFEIKSKSDTLKRLVRQGGQYQKSFERITLVCATKHILPAQEIIPDFWGIWEVDDQGRLNVLRQATANPYINVVGVVDLMENDESREYLKSKGSVTGLSKLSHYDMCQRIEALYSLKDVITWAKDTLPKRQRLKLSKSTQFSLPYLELSA